MAKTHTHTYHAEIALEHEEGEVYVHVHVATMYSDGDIDDQDAQILGVEGETYSVLGGSTLSDNERAYVEKYAEELAEDDLRDAGDSRERGDDDGVEYGDPRDYLAGRE